MSWLFKTQGSAELCGAVMTEVVGTSCGGAFCIASLESF